MFSLTDATNLRESLAEMDFHGPTLNEVESEDRTLLDKYVAHYGLSFPGQDITHRIGKFTVAADESSEFTIACQYFRLPRQREMGTAFLLHGYFDHTGLFVHLIRHCIECGYSVVIFDQPGHGLSSGPVASIDSFARYVSVLNTCLELADQQQLPQPWQLIGQSTGCAVIMDGIQSQASPLLSRIENFILLAPLLRPHRWAQLRFLFFLLRHFLKSIPRGFPENSHDQEFLNFLSHHDALQSRIVAVDWLASMHRYQKAFLAADPQPVELHIIQGSDDTTVDWKYNLSKIGEKFPQAKTTMVTDARHHMVNESVEYRERIFGTISEILQGDQNALLRN